MLLALPVLVACADTPDAYNPIEWGRSAVRGVGSLFEGLPPDAEPPPAEGRPYPNLATVPRPPQVAPRAEREAELAALQADHDAAAAADRELRATGTASPAAPPAPMVGESPAPAMPQTAAPPAPVAPPMLASPVPTPPPGASTRRPAAVAQAQASAATMLRRAGAVAFGRSSADLSDAGRQALANAAALARAGNARIRLVPAQVARQMPPAELLRARQEAILQALAAAGVARERVRIDDGGGRRVDVYDIYVES